MAVAPPVTPRWRQWLTLAAAVLLLDISVTFENIWPTPAVTWHGGLSIELAVCLLAIAAASRSIGQENRTAIGWIAVVWMALTAGRYAEVTTPALYGRDINLYWDLRFMPDVVAMVTRVAPFWLIAVSVLVIVVVVVLLYRLFRWAWRRIGSAMTDRAQRQALIVLSLVTIVLFAVQSASGSARGVSVGTPVTATYARQIRFVVGATLGSTPLAVSPRMDSDLSRVRGADVYVVFMESYGAIAFERPDIASGLASSRDRFSTDIHESGRDVVSAYVQSPTFGGSSWFAHLSLLSGVEVRDPDTNARLMVQRRDTLARAFGRNGYRTVALMPGLRRTWPEGAFYGFDEIYGADRLAYRGPQFGWFAIPDQFSLERLNALEAGRADRPPLFVFFPTVSTHFPFSPTPPYQPDWTRVSAERPYDGPAIVRAYAHQPDWTNFAPGYVEAMAYDYATVGGFLRTQPQTGRDLVMIVLGDHQPAAAVSGEGASWDVPVHVIASRATVLDAFLAHGFRSGVVPARPSLGPMHQLTPVLLDAFGNHP